jgi:hypothetical protein
LSTTQIQLVSGNARANLESLSCFQAHLSSHEDRRGDPRTRPNLSSPIPTLSPETQREKRIRGAGRDAGATLLPLSGLGAGVSSGGMGCIGLASTSLAFLGEASRLRLIGFFVLLTITPLCKQ